MAIRGYQRHLSHGDVILKDKRGRTQKFEKILSVLLDFRPEIHRALCLDLGCSNGIMTSLLAQHLAVAVGVDIDEEAVHYAKEHASPLRAHFAMADAMNLPFGDRSIDLIVCNHVYEHVPDAKRMMSEIYRVLKVDGFCYFSAGNKYMIIEGHYGLPFLSWVPKPLAHLYLKWAGKGDFYYEEHLSLRGLRGLVKEFKVHDYTLPIIRDPEKYCATDLFDRASSPYRWIKRLAPYLYGWIPTYIWVLTKK